MGRLSSKWVCNRTGHLWTIYAGDYEANVHEVPDGYFHGELTRGALLEVIGLDGRVLEDRGRVEIPCSPAFPTPYLAGREARRLAERRLKRLCGEPVLAWGKSKSWLQRSAVVAVLSNGKKIGVRRTCEGWEWTAEGQLWCANGLYPIKRLAQLAAERALDVEA
jgi:hypothetical protein